MKALIMMLENTSLKTFHPILYIEAPLPGSAGADKIIRYKSKGHRTVGFTDYNEAVKSVEKEVLPKLTDHIVTQDFEGVILWDGDGIPADVQLRSV